MIELNPERLDELSALVAEHMRAGGETREAARWSARAAYWAGHSRPRESLRLWQAVSDLTDELEEDEEVAALAINSRLLQLQYAWRVGMSAEEQARLAAEVEEIATRHNDLHSRALLRVATSVRPGLPHRGRGLAGGGRGNGRARRRVGRPAPAGRGPRRRRLRLPLHGRLRRLRGDARRSAGAGAGRPHASAPASILGSPSAWAVMGKGMVRRERGQYEEAEELFERALRADGRGGRSGDRELGAQQPGRAAGAPRGRRGRPGDRPPQLRADRAPRRRLLAQPGPGQPRLGAARRGGIRGRRWPRSRRPSGSTARRWTTAARWRPGGRRCGRRR